MPTIEVHEINPATGLPNGQGHVYSVRAEIRKVADDFKTRSRMRTTGTRTSKAKARRRTIELRQARALKGGRS